MMRLEPAARADGLQNTACLSAADLDELMRDSLTQMILQKSLSCMWNEN